MRLNITITSVHHIDGLIVVHFSDGTASTYTAAELLSLHPQRERTLPERRTPVEQW